MDAKVKMLHSRWILQLEFGGCWWTDPDLSGITSVEHRTEKLQLQLSNKYSIRNRNSSKNISLSQWQCSAVPGLFQLLSESLTALLCPVRWETISTTGTDSWAYICE